MSEPFRIRDLRAEMGLTLGQFARKVGITSPGHMSEIERGGACSAAVALRIDELSGHRIDAATLSTDVALVDASRAARLVHVISTEQREAA